MMDRRMIQLGDVQIPYLFGNDCFDEIGSYIRGLDPDRIVLVTDDVVRRIYGEALCDAIGRRVPITVLSAAPGESMKSLELVASHLEQALADGASRQSVVVALGGGVPGNLAGVMASLLFRGVRLVHVPTSTIAAMDSVLSLKQAVNSRAGKNHFGSYYRPEAILVDVNCFRTLPDREHRSGLCEMAKNCLAIAPDSIPGLRGALAATDRSDPEVLKWLLDASIRAKTSVTIDDSREKQAGLVLEYGHTVGHGIELLDHHRSNGRGLSHGDCVAIGMLVSARISAGRGWLSKWDVALHDDLVAELGVPIGTIDQLPSDAVLSAIRKDNKRGYLEPLSGTVPFVLLEGIGSPAWTGDVPLVAVYMDEVSSALDGLRAASSLVFESGAAVRSAL